MNGRGGESSDSPPLTYVTSLHRVAVSAGTKFALAFVWQVLTSPGRGEMSLSIRTLTVCTVGMLTLSACATRGALRRGLEEERTARIAADNAQQGDIAALRIDVTNLRNDLTSLRTEFGAKIRSEERRVGEGGRCA